MSAELQRQLRAQLDALHWRLQYWQTVITDSDRMIARAEARVKAVESERDDLLADIERAPVALARIQTQIRRTKVMITEASSGGQRLAQLAAEIRRLQEETRE